MTERKKDLLVLLIINVLGIIYTLFVQKIFIGKALIVSLVFLSPACLYLGLRKKKQWKKIFFSTLVFGLLFGFFFEFIQEYNRAYQVVSSLFPFKLFGVLPPDNVLGHMLMTFSTMVYYEHFVDFKFNSSVSKRFVILTVAAISINIVMLALFFQKSTLLKIDYSYALFGTFAIIPVFLLAFKDPKRIKDMLIVGIYFFFFYFMFELLAVKFNWWIYPGNTYIGWVNILGLKFPFEELFFWMMFYAPTLVSYRELFLEKH